MISVRDGESSYVNDGWETRQERNREVIHSLPLGTPIEDMTRQLGTPDFSEAFRAEAGEYRVLFYRTHRVHSDRMTTRDESTPVVFFNGEMVGFGEDFYRGVAGR